MQRLLQGLKPTTSRAHYDLLLAVTGGQPRLAAAYLAGTAAALEPKASLRWWAGVTLTGRLVSQASALPLPFLRLAERCAHCVKGDTCCLIGARPTCCGVLVEVLNLCH